MIADFHNDYLTVSSTAAVLKEYAQSKNIIVGAIFKGSRDYISAKTILNFFLKNRTENLYFAFEDFSYDEDINNLIHGLIRFKPSYVSLTWNGENSLAYGVGSSGKIKRKGIEVIDALKKFDVPLDVAHLSEESFYDALNYTDNLICSHTCFFEANNHPRNLKHGQIKEIVMRGGLIGLALYLPFLTTKNEGNIIDVFKHIDYFAQSFGVQNLSLGTDFYGCNDLPSGFKDYAFEEELYEFLDKHGYKRVDIDAILYKNLANFLNKKHLKPC